jgi:hypothetical protein
MSNISFAVDQPLTDITGLTLGDIFTDKRGRQFMLFQVDTALINDTLANGEVCFLKASHVVTNDVSDGIDGADSPIVAGVACGSIPESSASVTRYVLLLVKGRHTAVKTNGDDDIAAGDMLSADLTVDGSCDSINDDTETLDPGYLGRSRVGVALADDVNAANTVDAMVSAGILL